MRKCILLIVVSFFVSLLFTSHSFAHESFEGVSIHMDEKGFSPSTITVKVGERISFENTGKEAHWPASNIHPTHGVYSAFDPKRGIKPEETWSFVFEKAGSWRFHDHLFPEFTGTVTVRVSEEKDRSFFEKIMSFFKQFLPWTKDERTFSYPYNDSIGTNDTTISSNEAALFSYVKKFGTKQAMKQLVSVDHAAGKDCHQAAHALGKFTYEIDGEKAFTSCSADCHSGCYHGATEAFFKEHGTTDLQANLKILCGGGLNAFFEHQCLHGVGHGLMVWSDYEIHKALKDCDLLSQGQESCYSGIFMENIVGGLAIASKANTKEEWSKHYTKYLNNDPQFPCTVVAEKYKNACYFYQSTRMAQLLQYDFAKVSQACLQAPEEYQSLCFDSVGRDISSFTGRDPEKAIALCQEAPYGALRIGCLTGAVQDTFWESGGQDTALGFCKSLTDIAEKDACYAMIIERATQVLSTQQERAQFCQQVEEQYQANCLL